MKKDLTEIVFILDRSGSMSGLEADTIGGYNSMIKKQKKEAGEALITTVLFDDVQEVLYSREKLEKVEKMTERQYFVRGCTALLDAIGTTMHSISEKQKEMPKEERPSKTLFIITTDGMENASQHYTFEKIKQMVEKKKEKRGWEFLFLGANIDAIHVAGSIGVSANHAVNYCNDSKGTQLNFKVLSNVISGVRRCANASGVAAMFDEADCLAEIREDHEKRA